jgi:hypothetical protein
MHPVPIPSSLVQPNQTRRVISAPGGDLLDTSVAPVEALVEDHQGSPLYSVRVQLDRGDLQRLNRGDKVWVRFWGVIPPFEIEVGP